MEKGIKPFESADDDLYTYPFDNARIAARLKARKMRDSVALLSPWNMSYMPRPLTKILSLTV